MMDIEKLVRENIRRLTPYSSARDDYKGKPGVFLDANENPYGTLNRYPDPYQQELRSAVARQKGVDNKCLFIGNGSDEIIDLTLRIFGNPGTDKVMIFPPTYGMYEVSANINDLGIVRVPLNENFQINVTEAEKHFSDSSIKVMFICSPNNPTGNCMHPENIEYLVSQFRGIVLLDEAYSDFSDKPSFIRKTERYPNLVVMQTFSKAMGLAAARIGMAFADPAIIRYFNKVKPPYNVSGINQKAALSKIAEGISFRDQVKEIIRERERMAGEIRKLPLTRKVFPSDANFLLVKVTDADMIYEKLVNNDIIVRNRSSVVENCLRITIGTPNENDLLLEALKSISV
ncbi:MAG TPA: histidinol-phosphate transaminase [Bacteroidales bacterium]|nr:histidinol-phosphate transaminase [Bacteroidales bacterium]HRR93949.1 histidinol-phosphate transaminase [Bacteroidales bacterium]HRT89635.1 histidinol-phosphate transaminase [Bacteroidales bacterium]